MSQRKKQPSEKAKAAWKKNLDKHEMSQNLRGFMVGFVAAALPLVVIIGLLLWV